MAHEKELTNAELTYTCSFLLKRLTEVSVRFEALRSLLIQSGVVSQDDFDRFLKQMDDVHDAVLLELLKKATADENAARLRALLENYQGPKQ